MKTNQKEINIKSLIKDFSIETTPNVYAKYGQFTEFLSEKNDVYVTYLPDEKSENVIETSKKINEEGLTAIPHLPARTIKDNSELEKYIGSLSEIAGCNKILVIGGGSIQTGNIASSMQVLKTDLLSKYNFVQVGLAGILRGTLIFLIKNLIKQLLKKICLRKMLILRCI